jgi:hypothetical protein
MHRPLVDPTASAPDIERASTQRRLRMTPLAARTHLGAYGIRTRAAPRVSEPLAASAVRTAPRPPPHRLSRQQLRWSLQPHRTARRELQRLHRPWPQPQVRVPLPVPPIPYIHTYVSCFPCHAHGAVHTPHRCTEVRRALNTNLFGFAHSLSRANPRVRTYVALTHLRFGLCNDLFVSDVPVCTLSFECRPLVNPTAPHPDRVRPRACKYATTVTYDTSGGVYTPGRIRSTHTSSTSRFGIRRRHGGADRTAAAAAPAFAATTALEPPTSPGCSAGAAAPPSSLAYVPHEPCLHSRFHV